MLCWELNCTGNRGKAGKVIQQMVDIFQQIGCGVHC